MKLIETNLQQIFELCRKHNVKTLSVFGSILTDRFNSESDVDLLVDFDSGNIEDYVSNYFNFKDSLSSLLGRDADLLEENGIKNRFSLKNLNSSKRLIYG